MVIRTIVSQAGQAYVGIGGGITSDSDPDSEYQETQLKAKALLGAVGKSAW
jgi:anthranilate/para-aminobenzoate synthase component I